MVYFTVIVILSQATFFSFSEQAIFTNLVNCPCGISGQNITVHVTNSNISDPCRKWANCKSCQDGVDQCLECPEGFEGSACTKERIETATTRKKRQNLSQNQDHRRLTRVNLHTTHCDDPGFISNGYRMTNAEGESTLRRTFEERDWVYYGCESEEYELQGDAYLHCTEGDWSTFLPECVRPIAIRQKTTCSDPGFISNGVRVTTDGRRSTKRQTFENGQSLIFGCSSDEYALQGETFLTCNNGDWSRNVPKCVKNVASFEKPTCEDPGFITNGVRLNTDEIESTTRRTFEDGESVIYACRSEEYALQGAPFLSCRNGAWSRTLPKCVKTVAERPKPTCRDPGFISNGVRRNTDGSDSTIRRPFKDGESVLFECRSEEYSLQGNSFVTCNDGDWTSDLPTCFKNSVERERLTCRDPGFISNGVRRTADDNNVATIRRQFEDGESVLFECRSEEYSLQGEYFVTCNDGDWSSDLPKCVKKPVLREKLTCRDPGFISNGIRKITDGSDATIRRPFEDGESVMFECMSEEYSMQGEYFVTCNDGDWSSDLPKCFKKTVIREKSTCEDPGFISNGVRTNIDGSDSSIRRTFEGGDHVVFECRSKEFTLQGDNIITCNEGDWSRALPKCVKKAVAGTPKGWCPDPGQISNADRFFLDGRLSLGNGLHRVGRSLKFVCHRGFSMKQSGIMTCKGQGGKWTVAVPNCTPSSSVSPTTPVTSGGMCPDPGPVSNADRFNSDGSPSLGATQYKLGQSVTYSCLPGFSLEQGNTITCLRRRMWSTPKPSCKPIRSSAPPITSDNLVYCLHPPSVPDGLVADTSKPNTRPGDDGTLNEIEFPQGTRLKYSCQTRYTLQGADTLVCEKTGLWSDIPPTCSPIVGANRGNALSCKHPGQVSGGELTFVSPASGPSVSRNDVKFPVGTNLKYSCNPGFTLLGEPEVSCQSQGNWTARSSNWITSCSDGTE